MRQKYDLQYILQTNGGTKRVKLSAQVHTARKQCLIVHKTDVLGKKANITGEGKKNRSLVSVCERKYEYIETYMQSIVQLKGKKVITRRSGMS